MGYFDPQTAYEFSYLNKYCTATAGGGGTGNTWADPYTLTEMFTFIASNPSGYRYNFLVGNYTVGTNLTTPVFNENSPSQFVGWKSESLLVDDFTTMPNWDFTTLGSGNAFSANTFTRMFGIKFSNTPANAVDLTGSNYHNFVKCAFDTVVGNGINCNLEQNCMIIECLFDTVTAASVAVYNNCLIHGCSFIDSRVPTDDFATTIQFCKFVNQVGALGADTANRYLFNTFYNSTDAAISFSSTFSQNGQIIGNLVVNAGGVGISNGEPIQFAWNNVYNSTGANYAANNAYHAYSNQELDPDFVDLVDFLPQASGLLNQYIPGYGNMNIGANQGGAGGGGGGFVDFHSSPFIKGLRNG